MVLAQVVCGVGSSVSYLYMAGIAVATFACAYLLIWPIDRFAQRHGLLVQPDDERRIHRQPTAQLGGIAMYIAFLFGLALTFLPLPCYSGWQGEDRAKVLLLIFGATIIFVVALLDDLRPLPALPRLLLQFIAAGIVILPYLFTGTSDPASGLKLGSSGILIDTINVPLFFQHLLNLPLAAPIAGGTATIVIPLILALPATFVWVVGITNALNWIDGMDGLAAGVTLISSLVLFLRTFGLGQEMLAFLPAVLGAAALGFLPHNWHPARIFMGDNGAMFLGYVLAVISFIGGAKLATALLVLGVPLIDMAWLIIYRIIRGGNPTRAGRSHLHHRLLDIGLSQRQVALLFYGLCAGFGALGLLLPNSASKLAALLLMGIVIGGFLVYIARREFDRRV